MLLLRLSAAGPFEVIDTAGPRVGHVKDAIIAKFRLDAAPQQLQLYRLNGSSRAPLDPALTLCEAAVHDGTKLAVEHVAASSAFKGMCVCVCVCV